MKKLTQVIRLILFTVITAVTLNAELPQELKDLIRRDSTQEIIEKLYDHHMLGSVDLRVLIHKHLDPLLELTAKPKLVTARASVQTAAPTREHLIAAENAALQGLKQALNIALGSVTQAQTPSWLNIDVINRLTMRATPLQASKEFVFGNAGKIQMGLVVAAVLAFIFKDKIKTMAEDKLGELAKKVSLNFMSAFKAKDNTEHFARMAKGVVADPEVKKEAGAFVKEAAQTALEDGEVQQKAREFVRVAVADAVNPEAVRTQLEKPEMKAALAATGTEMLTTALADSKTKKALEDNIDACMARMQVAFDKKLQEAEQRFAALVDKKSMDVENQLTDFVERVKLPIGKVSVKPKSTPVVPLVQSLTQVPSVQLTTGTQVAAVTPSVQGTKKDGRNWFQRLWS